MSDIRTEFGTCGFLLGWEKKFLQIFKNITIIKFFSKIYQWKFYRTYRQSSPRCLQSFESIHCFFAELLRGEGERFLIFFLAVKMLLECCKITGTYFTSCPTYVPSLELVAFCLTEKKNFQKFSKIARLSNFSREKIQIKISRHVQEVMP